jgi:hypothetical protein
MIGRFKERAMLIKLKYTFQAFQKDHFWLPIAIMALFSVVAFFAPDANKYNTARAFLGFVLPLIGGGLSSYGFLADNALELQFTTKHSTWRMIFGRLGFIFSMICITSLSFQIIVAFMGISLAPLGGIIQRQLIWLVPCMTLMVFGGASSLMAESCSGGFALVGGVWIIQLLLRGWFARKPILRNILLFLGAMDPLGQLRIYNQLTLTAISLLLLAMTYLLLKQQEKYI